MLHPAPPKPSQADLYSLYPAGGRPVYLGVWQEQKVFVREMTWGETHKESAAGRMVYGSEMLHIDFREGVPGGAGTCLAVYLYDNLDTTNPWTHTLERWLADWSRNPLEHQLLMLRWTPGWLRALTAAQKHSIDMLVSLRTVLVDKQQQCAAIAPFELYPPGLFPIPAIQADDWCLPSTGRPCTRSLVVTATLYPGAQEAAKHNASQTTNLVQQLCYLLAACFTGNPSHGIPSNLPECEY
jgi:hypothetical protein